MQGQWKYRPLTGIIQEASNHCGGPARLDDGRAHENWSVGDFDPTLPTNCFIEMVNNRLAGGILWKWAGGPVEDLHQRSLSDSGDVLCNCSVCLSLDTVCGSGHDPCWSFWPDLGPTLQHLDDPIEELLRDRPIATFPHLSDLFTPTRIIGKCNGTTVSHPVNRVRVLGAGRPALPFVDDDVNPARVLACK